jgi:hypothetical protein
VIITEVADRSRHASRLTRKRHTLYERPVVDISFDPNGPLSMYYEPLAPSSSRNASRSEPGERLRHEHDLSHGYGFCAFAESGSLDRLG